MNIAYSLTDLIGRTPLLEACNLARAEHLKAHLLLKLESFNPGGSVKDRAALAMIETAERAGTLTPGATIIEPTSGNTGIGLAWIGASRGYKVILTMPESMSLERRRLLAAYGATLVLTPAAEGMKGAISKARELQGEIPGSWIPMQFDNRSNPAVHASTTAREIWQDTDGHIDILVAGVGTGGTVSGMAHALRKRNPQLKVYAVEPAESPVLSGGKPGPHRIQGIGAGFVPGNFDRHAVDGIITVPGDEACAVARLLARHEGLLCGISSGAATAAAMQLARLPENEGLNIVAILPDTGERYLSTGVFDTPAD